MTSHAHSGIYAITHKLSGKCYIGSSKNTKNRISVHRSNLRGGTHFNKFLQSAWNKYGESSFVFNKMISCDVKNLIHFEQMMMDVQQSYDKRFGYNLKPKAESNLGITLSDKHKKKISDSLIGKNTWSKGRKQSEEHTKKNAVGHTKTHCKRGHALVEGNLYYRQNGDRICRRCTLDYQKANDKRPRKGKAGNS